MPRIRTIKPEFWLDKKIRALSPWARLLYIGLWNLCDDEGRYDYDADVIKGQLFVTDKVDVAELLKELVAPGLIVRYIVDDNEYFYIPSWHDHQVINKPSKFRKPAPTPESCITPTPLPEGSGTPTGGKGKGKGKGKGGEKDVHLKSFRAFYLVYPRHEARADAEKAWLALAPDAELVSSIMGALSMHKVSESWLKENGKFVPLPASWIRGKRWEDSVVSKYAMEDLPQLKARLIKARENKKWWEDQIKEFGKLADLSAKLSAAEAEIAMLGPEIKRLEA